jgi:hypothetical protein
MVFQLFFRNSLKNPLKINKIIENRFFFNFFYEILNTNYIRSIIVLLKKVLLYNFKKIKVFYDLFYELWLIEAYVPFFYWLFYDS